MELKCPSSVEISVMAECSNRTFMELKYRSEQRGQQHRYGSNRTFMELK